MTIVHTLPAPCMKPQCLNQQQLDQQSCRSQLWTKTKAKMQSLSTLLKQVRTEAENAVLWFMPYTEQCCDSGLSWHTSQLLWSTFCRAGQRRHLPVGCFLFWRMFTRRLLSLLPLSHWFKTITEDSYGKLQRVACFQVAGFSIVHSGSSINKCRNRWYLLASLPIFGSEEHGN